MLYAILAYHVEAEVLSWTPEEDAALMTDLLRVHHRLIEEGRLGPAARLGPTKKALTLRGPGAGLVVDGPFAETKEQLLGFYTIDCATEEAAIEAARDLRRANPNAVYEIRPMSSLSAGSGLPAHRGRNGRQLAATIVPWSKPVDHAANQTPPPGLADSTATAKIRFTAAATRSSRSR